MTRRTISDTFAALRAKKQIGLIPFIPAGYPDLPSTAAALPALDAAGASVIEIGFPFSDPVADGPTIQEAYNVALKAGTKVTNIFATIASARDKFSAPLLAMVSYSIAFRYDLKKFLADAKTAGFDAMLFPDLPPPEAQSVTDAVRSAGLDTVLLVAPSSTPQRRKQIADLSTGFIYYLSVAGITGQRDALPENLAANLQHLRSLTDKPLAVGFGIHKPEHLTQLAPHADAAIVGSAIVKHMRDATPRSPQSVSTAIANYCRDLLAR